MGRVARVYIKRAKCIGCGGRLQVSKKQSKINQNVAEIVGYCFKREKHENHEVYKFYIKSLIAKNDVEPEADVIIEIDQRRSDLS